MGIVRNRKEENLIMVGFIRRMYKSTQFKGVSVMPVDIIGYASKWVAVEYVHVIEIKNGLYGSPYGKYQGVHIRIGVDYHKFTPVIRRWLLSSVYSLFLLI